VLWSGDAVIAAAEECRRQAEDMVGVPPYGGLAGQPSCWCIVTKKRNSRLVYHTPADEQNLRAHIAIGHRVILTLGLVVSRDALRLPLNPYNHVAIVSIAKPPGFSSARLARIASEAKAYAAAALQRCVAG